MFLNRNFVMVLNNVCLRGFAAGWSTLTRRCEIQPARLPCLSTSTSRLPSYTRSSSWVLFSCSTTAPALNRWRMSRCYWCIIFLSIFMSSSVFFLFVCLLISHWLERSWEIKQDKSERGILKITNINTSFSSTAWSVQEGLMWRKKDL